MRKGMWGLIVSIVLSFSEAMAAFDARCYNNRINARAAWDGCLAAEASEAATRPWLGPMTKTLETWIDGRVYFRCHLSPDSTGYIARDYRSNLFETYCNPSLAPGETSSSDNSNSCTANGSIIQTANQVLGETIPLTGSSFDLVYFSNRVIGRTADYTIKLPLRGTEDNETVLAYNVILKNELGSTIESVSLPTIINLTYTNTWNGIDASLNETWASIQRTLTVAENATDFSFPTMPKNIYVGSLKAKKLGTGAWLPSIWHFYDFNAGKLYKGDGTFRNVGWIGVVGGLVRVPDISGKEVYYFDSTGKIVETRTGRTGALLYSFAYDSAGRISTITEPFGKVTTFSRYLTGVLKAIVTPTGAKTSITMNSNGYLATATNPNAEMYSMTYSGTGGLLQTFTKPSGNVTTLTYDSEGNLTSDLNSSGKSSTLARTATGITLTSAMGRATGNAANRFSKEEKVTNASGLPITNTVREEQSIFQSPGVQVTTNYVPDTRFGGQATVISSMSETDFGSKNSTYTRINNLSDINNPFSINSLSEKIVSGISELTSVYTGSTRTTVTTSKLGRTKTTQVDELERPTLEQIGALVAKDYVYTNNLLTKITQGTRKTVMSYYSNNLLKSIRNSLDQITTFTYDSAQRLLTKTLPDSRVINYSYDSDGNLTSITPPGKPIHELSYEIDGKLETYSPPTLSGVSDVNTTYTYNNDRQMTKITRPDGQVINYNYNATSGLLTSITGAFTTINRTYTQGRLDNVTQGSRIQVLGYNGSMPSFSLLVDSSANLVRFDRSPSSAFGGKIGQEKITTFIGGTKERAINYVYDTDGLLKKAGDLELTVDVPNGQLQGTTIGRINDSYYYNAFGEIRRYIAKVGTRVIYEYELYRDSTGRITKKIETLNEVTTAHDYVYDAAGRLVQVSDNGVVAATYEYDSNSNRIGGIIRGETTSATYDDQDRLTEYNGVALTYNANGELASKGDAALVYDAFGNLKSHTKGTTVVSYEVDPLQRRFGRLVDGVRTARYVYNPEGKVIGQLDANNKLIKAFVYAAKSHVPDYYIDQNNNKFRIITDHLGSVRLVVSNTGRVLQMMEHDEFGRVLQDTRPGFLPFGFAGGLYEYRTGLVRFGARDYDPETGSWLSKDPIRFNGNDTNLYGYVMQDPVNFIDPNGLFSIPQVPTPIYSPVPMQNLPKQPINSPPTLLEKAVHLLNIPTPTPADEDRALDLFFDNVINGKENEFSNLHCPKG